MERPKHTDDPEITKTDTGYTVDFGDTRVGVGSEQASNQKEALAVARKVYAEAEESRKKENGTN